ncbi:ABC transporter ATP-binding protein [Pelotalea chapellei]|uniref:ABC transporter ATP-binding protein n=1 Tax=Pelotalea chapellei TaxID=44671 RepID=A0ABS5U7W1_9BACT|nr:ABC transporter ATP-binding protein [Pelotalea chapellei]MBT1071756.1 ABC transporter ATP-binding protein [Pelotalea chapellei]
MSIVISVENLGKKYNLIHQQREPYTALRDVITNGFTSFGKKIISPFIPKSKLARYQSPTSEEFWALKDVSFEVKQGDRIGIIGRNGAGKSTLLKILSRITEPTTGSVRIKGRVASLLEVGTGFHPELTGRENIFLNGAILGMGRAEIKKKFDEIVDFAEIEKFLDTPVKRYSSGMYVRLAFAVAAHLEPEILIVDEVLAVGDAQFQKKCLGKMEDVSAKEGRTVLFVSHNMGAVRSLCSRAILLERGGTAMQGSVSSTIDTYLEGVAIINACDFNLAALPRVGSFGSHLRILRLCFNQGMGIWHGKPLEVEMTFDCRADVFDVSFGVGLCNRDGARVVTIDSDALGKRFNLHGGERGVAKFSLEEFQLAPDTYTLDVGARSGDTFGLEYLSPCGQIFVAPSDVTPSSIVLRESVSGGYRPIARWDISCH